MPIDQIDALKLMSFQKQLAFAYLTCERLYPNYVQFSKETNFGKPLVLRRGIELIYDNIFEHSSSTTEISKASKLIQKYTPDTDDFATNLVSAALDSCTAILDTFDFILDHDFQRIITISSYATDTVDLYLYDLKLNSSAKYDFTLPAENQPFMVREVATQNGIITYFSKRLTLDQADLADLLNLQNNNNRSNIDL